MHIKDLYSVIVTDNRAECRNFYVKWFAFQVVFEASWFVYLAAAGEPYPLHDEPWGQRRFALCDPSGTWLEVIQQIDPAPGFWDSYLR